MIGALELVERLLANGDPETVLDLADRDNALRLAGRILATDPAAAREFGDAAPIAGYLRSIALPQVLAARRAIASRRAAPAAPPAASEKVPQPAAVAMLTDTAAEQWGSLDALAEVLQLRVPMLRQPAAIAALRAAGIEAQRTNGREVWPLQAARRLPATAREKIVLAVAARMHVAGGLVRIH